MEHLTLKNNSSELTFTERLIFNRKNNYFNGFSKKELLLLNLFLNSLNTNKYTQKAYLCDIRKFFIFIHKRGIKFSVINREIIEIYKQSLTGLKSSTINKNLTVVSKFFEFLNIRYNFPNPCIGIKRESIDFYEKIKTTSISKEELGDVIDLLKRERDIAIDAYLKCKEDDRNTQESIRAVLCKLSNICIVKILFETGIRVSDVVKINHDDFYYQNDSLLLKVTFQKTKKTINIELSNELTLDIEHYRDIKSALFNLNEKFSNNKNIPFFSSTDRAAVKNKILKYRTVQSVNKFFNYLSCELNWDRPFHPHVARSSFAKFNKHLPLDVAKEQMGHRSILTTEKYR